MNRDQKTLDMISTMLKTNTGAHFLDSGSVHGRHWERNQGRDFINENRVALSFRYGSVEYTKNVFFHMADNLTYDEELDQVFQAFSRQQPSDQSYLADIELFLEELVNVHGCDVHGLYGEGEPFSVNTYNHDSNLSQGLQYTYLSIDGKINGVNYRGEYVLLQVHNGCDIRGGYTRPRVFEVTGDQFLMDQDGYISCPHCGASWYTDDNYHWYINDPGTSGNARVIKQLEDYKIMDIEDYIQDNRPNLGEAEPLRLDDVLLADQYGNGRCPGCYSILEGR